MFEDLRYFGSDTDYDCAALKNQTSLITNAYSGIPETLILNVISWILLIILFTTLRHQAGDYGRLALVNANGSKKRWTEIFYSRGSSVIEQREQEEHQRQQLYNNQQDASTSRSDHVESPRPSVGSNAADSTPLSPIHYDQGLLSWIIITFKLKKQQILLHTGPDAVHYLSFQQHLMIVMAIVTSVSLVVILPVNFLNGPDDTPYDVNSFARTTMANLSPDSAWLWVHVMVCIIYVPLTVLIMRRASGRNAFKKSATRTIMITNISSNDRNKAVIRNYMQDLFPDVRIEDVQIAYNISKLAEKHNEYERVLDARMYCEQHRDRDSLQVKPDFCSCHKEKAYEYYQKEERTLFGDVARLKASALNEPLGIAFLTVSTVTEAQNIVSHFTPGTYRQWNLTFAPSPDDIFWENLNVSKSHWYIKWSVVNVILFVVLFFLTTPAIVITLLYNWHIIDKEKSSLNPVVSEFLPTIMLWTLSALMPVIVAFSDKWLSHYTRSLQNYAIMTKCFGYLLLMILILPSLGLTSADALLRWSISEDPQRWKCFFLPDRGSFYCNYVITAAFIGTSLELMRFPELIVYIWELIKSKSKAETYHIRKSILIEFPFGTHYAWTTLVFTISMVYSVFCPLIMPFAMVYICFKHFVDRYNLYFAYGPSNMISRNGGKIHSTAVTMTKFALVLLLLIMAMISFIRGSGSSSGSGMARAIILIIALIITLTLFTFMSPIKKCTQARRPSIVETTGPAPIYVPEVLLSRSNSYVASNLANREQSTGHPTANNGYGGYGSDSVSDFDISSQYSTNSIDA